MSDLLESERRREQGHRELAARFDSQQEMRAKAIDELIEWM